MTTVKSRRKTSWSEEPFNFTTLHSVFEAFSVDGEVKFLPAGFGLFGRALKILIAELTVHSWV